MSINFNLEKWPVVYFKSNKYCNSDEEFDIYFDDYKKKYLELLLKCKNSNTKMILICDLYNALDIPLKYVMKQAQFNKEIYDHNKKYVEGVCILCKQKSFKNMLIAYFSLVKPASPYKLCRSFDKANLYLTKTLNVDIDISFFYKDGILDKFSDVIEEEEEDINEINI